MKKVLKKHYFGKQNEIVKYIPNLLEIQLDSYKQFLQKDVAPDKREKVGLQEAFESAFPIESHDGNIVLEFVDYDIEEPKYSESECRYIGKTYSAPLKARFRLIYKNTGEVKEQGVFMCDIPLMTSRGTFIINGAERVVVNQIHRSPGVFFGYNEQTGIFSSKIIPDKGAWIEFEITNKGMIIVRIDRKRKMFLGTFLKGIGLGSIPILKIKSIKDNEILVETDNTVAKKMPILGQLAFLENEEELPAEEIKEKFFIINKSTEEIKDDKVLLKLKIGREPYKALSGEELKTASKSMKYIAFSEKRALENNDNVLVSYPLYDLNQTILSLFYPVEKIKIKSGKKDVNRDEVLNKLLGQYAAVPIIGEDGALLLEVGGKITADIVEMVISEELPYIYVFDTKAYSEEAIIIKSVTKDVSKNAVEAIEKIMTIIRPGDILNYAKVEEDFKNFFYSEKLYNLNEVGRFKINTKFRYKEPVETKALIEADIINTVDYIVKMYIQEEEPDDIDHLSNRRIRCISELLTNQLKIAFSRMDRIIKERFTVQDPETFTPQTLISIKSLTSALNEFFGTSQLSQFMDQTNPLAELTHKRRLNALGPGGLTRERAGYEVRDVHYTHYGRMCPIETPEGPNIGLIVSLALMARLNKYGFIATPYRKVENGVVTNKIEYLTAAEEEFYKVAQANAPVDSNGKFKEKVVSARYKKNFLFVPAKEIDYMDVAPIQLFSASTSLIPFLEHDDANRALMGSNMQRQAVSLLKTEAPYVSTGLEKIVAENSGVLVFAKRPGTVIDVQFDTIVINPDNAKNKSDIDIYHLEKFRRTNQGTCYNQKPLVRIGDKVKKGDVIADGPAMDNGELALGKNLLVAFMPWEGYNYEDAILISQRVLKDDTFTSIHIEEFQVVARDTKLGREVITRDIPNLSEDALKDLDEDGIIRIGAEVKPGDILVGKVTPKGETELTPEYKLLHSIFGEKAREVRDTSLKVPYGSEGIVIDVKIFSREQGDELEPGIERMVKVYIAHKKKLQVGDKMSGRHGNKGIIARILPEEDMPFLEDGTPVDVVLNPLGVPSRMNIGQILETQLGWVAAKTNTRFITPVFESPSIEEIEKMLKDAGLPVNGKAVLYDGRTGEKFKYPVTTGYMYVLKLSHLADDKIHARSTGPYSLVTQQPLGGKAQFGGQRFGEMEVWALEAYGAANTLQELLTVKSDDMSGRARVYESIVKGKNASAPGIPESFNVLIQELRGLGLNITAFNSRGQQISMYETSTSDWKKTKHRSFDDMFGKK